MNRRMIMLGVLLWSARVLAYPQYQISHDDTCTSCHLSPAGGGLLSENGRIVAESFSQWGTSPEFINGVFDLPSWLALGGDLRWAAGVDHRRPSSTPFVTFPMQAELYGAATFNAISLHVTAGARDPKCDLSSPPTSQGCASDYSTLYASREHWLQWQQKPGETTGLFVRAGRFMPVYGLRYVEHPAYTRQYGGTPLYGEAYGVAAEYIESRWELHATGFVHDPLQASTELGNGAAVYGELRVQSKTAIGLESKVDVTTDDRKEYFGATAKHYFGSPGILIQGEGELVHQKVVAGGTANGAVAYALGTYFLGAVMIDLGLGYYSPDARIRYLDEEAADLNIHWFPTSHIELVALNRLQMLEFGAGGLTSGYSLLQIHYRL
jgi:hypothetical protein